MKKSILAALAAALALAVAQAQTPGAQSNVPQTTTIVSNGSGPAQYVQQPAQSAPPGVYVYDQRPAQQQPVLVSPADAQATVDAFRTNYEKLGSPRILIYVNRNLVDEQAGMKLTGRSETVKTTTKTDTNSTNNSSTSETTAKNNYTDNGSSAQPTLADRQTVRDVERLMGRPLRAAGVTLVDQRVAEQLMENRPLDSLAGETEQARKDRAAVNQIADVVLEVLMSSRSVTVPGFTSNHTYSVPDIQVTAIRLKDAKVVGQASATDVINHAGGPAVAARNYTVQDITEATGLALMGDMLQETK
jgi:hypothetical protein